MDKLTFPLRTAVLEFIFGVVAIWWVELKNVNFWGIAK